MIVVSDTSCITNLITIGAVDLLSSLFGEVIIPPAVERELRRTHPAMPGFIQVRVPADRAFIENLWRQLDQGEAEAIALAKELRADRLLIDEKDGRSIARREGLAIIGVLGILLLARRGNLIPSVKDALMRLEHDAGFFIDDVVKASVLHEAGEQL